MGVASLELGSVASSVWVWLVLTLGVVLVVGVLSSAEKCWHFALS